MPPGRQAKALDQRQIERLKEYQRAKRYTIPQLKLAMDGPFHWNVVSKALKGLPIWSLNHAFIVEWLDRFVPERGTSVSDFDSKRAASGERDDEIPEEAGAVQHPRLRSE